MCFQLSEIFPEIDAFIALIDDKELHEFVERRVAHIRQEGAIPEDMLLTIYYLVTDIPSHVFKFPKEIIESQEFQALKEKYLKLANAHNDSNQQMEEENTDGSSSYIDDSAKKWLEHMEGEDSILPKTGIKGTFQTPNGAITGIIETGAKMGGPYIIITAQGKIRVDKITGARYQ